jgi:glycosyltransferase involved in cell wall biosynthesis
MSTKQYKASQKYLLPEISKPIKSLKTDSKVNGFSVIIPCFNSKKTLKIVLDSLLLNVFDLPFEIIVIDDGSSDTVSEICKQYKKVQYYWKENGGVASARNFGVTKSQYKYIAFLDSDDIWLPEKIAKQANYIRKLNLRFVGCGWSNKFYPSNESIYKISYWILPFKWWPHISTVIMDKDFFIEIGGFNEDMRYAEDGDFLMKIAKVDQLYCMKENLVETAIQKNTNYESGLSSNLRLMYLGELYIVDTHFNSILLKKIYNAVIFSKFVLRIFLKKIN